MGDGDSEASGGGRWLLCCAGGWPDAAIVTPLVAASDRRVGVDGGADLARDRGVELSFAVGDMDSIEREDVNRIEVPSQSDTDLAKALTLAADQGASHVDVIGIDGGRTDHLLATFAALIEAPTGPEIHLHFEDFIAVRAGPDASLDLHLPPKTHLSLFAFTPCAHVTLTGARWPLDDEPLAFSTRGLHNEATGGPLHLRSDGPVVLLIRR